MAGCKSGTFICLLNYRSGAYVCSFKSAPVVKLFIDFEDVEAFSHYFLLLACRLLMSQCRLACCACHRWKSSSKSRLPLLLLFTIYLQVRSSTKRTTKIIFTRPRGGYETAKKALRISRPLLPPQQRSPCVSSLAL